MQQIAKYFVIAGLILVLSGFLIYFAGNKFHWLGHLPGDIRVEKENFKFYFPFTTMIIISVLLSLAIKLFQHFK
jgi:cytochrome b subunit of formate dehydrogenase